MLCVYVGTMCASVHARVCVCWVNVGKHSRSPFHFIHWLSVSQSNPELPEMLSSLRVQRVQTAVLGLCIEHFNWWAIFLAQHLRHGWPKKNTVCLVFTRPQGHWPMRSWQELSRCFWFCLVYISPPHLLCGSFQDFTHLRLIQIIAASFVGVRLMHTGHRIYLLHCTAPMTTEFSADTKVPHSAFETENNKRALSLTDSGFLDLLVWFRQSASFCVNDKSFVLTSWGSIRFAPTCKVLLACPLALLSASLNTGVKVACLLYLLREACLLGQQGEALPQHVCFLEGT